MMTAATRAAGQMMEAQEAVEGVATTLAVPVVEKLVVEAAVAVEAMPSAVEAEGAGQGTPGEGVELEAAISAQMVALARGAGAEGVGQESARRLPKSLQLTTTPSVE